MKNKRTCDYIAEAIQNEILSGRIVRETWLFENAGP